MTLQTPQWTLRPSELLQMDFIQRSSEMLQLYLIDMQLKDNEPIQVFSLYEQMYTLPKDYHIFLGYLLFRTNFGDGMYERTHRLILARRMIYESVFRITEYADVRINEILIPLNFLMASVVYFPNNHVKNEWSRMNLKIPSLCRERGHVYPVSLNEFFFKAVNQARRPRRQKRMWVYGRYLGEVMIWFGKYMDYRMFVLYSKRILDGYWDIAWQDFIADPPKRVSLNVFNTLYIKDK